MLVLKRLDKELYNSLILYFVTELRMFKTKALVGKSGCFGTKPCGKNSEGRNAVKNGLKSKIGVRELAMMKKLR